MSKPANTAVTGAGAVGYESGSQNDSGNTAALMPNADEQQQVQDELHVVGQLGEPHRELGDVHRAGGAVDQRDRARKNSDDTRLTMMYVTPARMRSPVPPSVSST